MPKNNLKLIFYSLVCFLFLVTTVKAQEFAPMSDFFNGLTGDSDPTAFIQLLYGASITIAALLAVVRIIYGGVQYMLTDVITQKGQAKKDIFGAILGLMIVLGAVFILNLINPQLTTFELFRSASNGAIQVQDADVDNVSI